MKRYAGGKHLKEDASNYDDSKYKKPSVTVDVAICTVVDDKLKILLIKRKYSPYKDCWAIPGGFVEVEQAETLHETAVRELKEETGVKNVYIEQLKTYGDPERDPRTRVITVAYFALVPHEEILKQDIKAADDAKETRWFDLRSLPDELAFDHRMILSDLRDRLIGKISYTPIAFHLVPKHFTWTQLRSIYEIVLGRKLLAPNFIRKINSLYDVKETTIKSPSAGRGRPGVLLKFMGTKDIY